MNFNTQKVEKNPLYRRNCGVMTVLVSRLFDALHLFRKALSAVQREQVIVVALDEIEMSTGPQMMGARMCNGGIFLKV